MLNKVSYYRLQIRRIKYDDLKRDAKELVNIDRGGQEATLDEIV